MTQNNPKNRYLVGLFLVGVLFFNYPLLSLFNHNLSILGIPLLYFYIFSVWIFLIAMMAVITTNTNRKQKKRPANTVRTDDIG